MRVGGVSAECRLVSVPVQKGYYANDPRKTRRGEFGAAQDEAQGGTSKEGGEGKTNREEET